MIKWIWVACENVVTVQCDNHFRLECTEECGVIERNKRLALALEIKNPDVSGKLGAPSYPEFLKDSARFVCY